jgi:hypothetical protein
MATASGASAASAARSAHEVFVGQRLDHAAVGPEAPAGLETQFGRYRRCRRQGRREIVEPRARLAADGQEIGEAAVGDEGGACALALEHGVGGDGRAVHDRAREPAEHAERGESFAGSRVRARRGWRAPCGSRRRSPSIEHEIGEGAAGVDAEESAHCGRLLAEKLIVREYIGFKDGLPCDGGSACE